MAAQQAAPVPTVAVQQRVEVTAAVAPDAESTSMTELSVQSLPMVSTTEEVLRTDPAVDVQERGGGGVQADLSIRGTTFEQTLVLVNGFRVNDPETSHLNMDISVPVDALETMDVLHGSGSTFYGSDAIGGAVNMLTVRPGRTAARLRAGFGSYGSEEQHLRADFAGTRAAETLTGSRDTSNGFVIDRGYHANAVASETWLKSGLGWTDVLLAMSDRPYGADQFYGPYNSTERTKGWFAAVRQPLGEKTEASFGYRRHTDLFVLYAGRPQVYENNHATESYQATVRRADQVGRNVVLSYGLEEDGDNIVSTNLGRHARNQGAGYVQVAASPGRLRMAVGAREEVLSGKGSVFSPSVSASYRVAENVRLRGAVGHGFRQPTYLDLYYSDPTTVGNPALKPESSWSYEGGMDWHRGPVAVKVTGFDLQQVDGIDYSKYSAGAKWQAVNIPTMGYRGVESSVAMEFRGGQSVTVGYTAVRAGSPPAGLISKYAFNYPAQNAVLAWQGEFGKQVLARTQVRVVQRTQQTAYPVWDVAVARSAGVWRPYVRLTNLSNTGYAEVPGVRVQGRAVMGGVELRLR